MNIGSVTASPAHLPQQPPKQDSKVVQPASVQLASPEDSDDGCDILCDTPSTESPVKTAEKVDSPPKDKTSLQFGAKSSADAKKPVPESADQGLATSSTKKPVSGLSASDSKKPVFESADQGAMTSSADGKKPVSETRERIPPRRRPSLLKTVVSIKGND